MATPPDTRPSTPGTPMASTIRDVFDFDERIFAAAGEMDKQTNPASNNKQELFVFQWLASVERELKRCGHVSFSRSIAIQTLNYDHGISFFPAWLTKFASNGTNPRLSLCGIRNRSQ